MANVLSVRAFGAVGDGATNDTQAFLAAFDVATQNRKALFVPSGTYLVDPMVVALPVNSTEGGRLTLFGEGAMTSILKLTVDSSQPLLKITRSVSSGSVWNVNIHDIGFDGIADAYQDPFPSFFPLLRFENLVFSQFSNLWIGNALYGGIEDIANETGSGGTTSRHNQYDTITLSHVNSNTVEDEQFAILLQNTKFHVLTNISIEDWGAGIFIQDTLTDLLDPESGGFTNLQGINVISCLGDGIRLGSTNWANVNGLNCMWIGRSAFDNPVLFGTGRPIHTIGPIDVIQPESANLSQNVFTNMIFRSSQNENIFMEGPKPSSKNIFADVYMTGGKAGLVAMGLQNCVLSNMIFDSILEDPEQDAPGIAIDLKVEPQKTAQSADVIIQGVQFINCTSCVVLNDGTTRISGRNMLFSHCVNGVVVNDTSSSIWMDDLAYIDPQGQLQNAIETKSGTQNCRFSTRNLSMDDSSKIILAGANNSVVFDGDRINVSTEFRVNASTTGAGERVVREQLGSIASPAADVNALKIAVDAIIARLKETGGHGLIAD